ncbi:MAG TPA: glycosyltransferase [Puia sp.]
MIRVNHEKAWLQRYIRLEQPDLIISDNRYGLYSREVTSIFITHQLRIRTPWGGFADEVLQRMNYRRIRRFDLCWVPDVPGADALAGELAGGLAGELAHPGRLPSIPTRYIGWLSRFPVAGKVEEQPCDLLVMLSGPEPQRSLLEKKLLEQLADYTGRTVLVRGMPEGRELQGPVPPQLTVYNHLPAAALEGVIRGAGQVIARSGYSTVMDLVRLGKRAILIPTPGQTEQEYLGDYVSSKGWAICIAQKGFSLADALAVARGRGNALPRDEGELLKAEIAAVLSAGFGIVEEPELGTR